MPVYRNNELLHIHIPKTGGTAIERYFHSIGDMVWGLPSWFGQQQRDRRWYEFQHLTLTELRGFVGDEFAGFGSFAVVRDPYARLVSEFLWRQRIVAHNPESFLRGFDSFDAFLDAIPDDIDAAWNDHVAGATKSETNFLIHVRPQHHYVGDTHGRIDADHIVQFEQLPDDLAPILEPLGLSTASFQRTHERNVAPYFGPAQLDRVAALYAPDFELFSYPRR